MTAVESDPTQGQGMSKEIFPDLSEATFGLLGRQRPHAMKVGHATQISLHVMLHPFLALQITHTPVCTMPSLRLARSWGVDICFLLADHLRCGNE